MAFFNSSSLSASERPSAIRPRGSMPHCPGAVVRAIRSLRQFQEPAGHRGIGPVAQGADAGIAARRIAAGNRLLDDLQGLMPPTRPRAGSTIVFCSSPSLSQTASSGSARSSASLMRCRHEHDRLFRRLALAPLSVLSNTSTSLGMSSVRGQLAQRLHRSGADVRLVGNGKVQQNGHGRRSLCGVGRSRSARFAAGDLWRPSIPPRFFRQRLRRGSAPGFAGRPFSPPPWRP